MQQLSLLLRDTNYIKEEWSSGILVEIEIASCNMVQERMRAVKKLLNIVSRFGPHSYQMIILRLAAYQEYNFDNPPKMLARHSLKNGVQSERRKWACT